MQGKLAVKVAAGVKAPTRGLYTGRIKDSLLRRRFCNRCIGPAQPVRKPIHGASALNLKVFDE
jgi:hypothetical protein